MEEIFDDLISVAPVKNKYSKHLTSTSFFCINTYNQVNPIPERQKLGSDISRSFIK